MGANNIKSVPDTHTESSKDLPSSSSCTVYKPHVSPTSSPTRDSFYTPLGSPEHNPTPMDTSPSPEDPGPSPEHLSTHHEHYRREETWGAPFSRAMERIQRASEALGHMHSQLGALLSPKPVSEGPRIVDSALGWEKRLGEVRKDLTIGLHEMGILKQKYQALTTGETLRSDAERGPGRDIQTGTKHLEGLKGETREDPHYLQDRRAPKPRKQEESAEHERLQVRILQLEKEKKTLSEKITELKGEVQDLTLLQSDLRTAVSVAERFREEAQEKLERAERENRRLRGKGYDTVDWTDTSPVNGGTPTYRSLPRGVILSSMRDPVMKSSSLMSVPPQGPLQDMGSGSRKERRGSLETLLNESKATFSPFCDITLSEGDQQ